MPRRQDSHPSGLTDSSKLHPAMWWANKLEKKYGRTKRLANKIPNVGGLPGVNIPAHRRLHDTNPVSATGSTTIILYTIGDIENDVSLPLVIPSALVGTIASIRVDGPSLNGDTFSLKVNGTTVTSVIEGNTATCLQPITASDSVEIVVTTVSTGTGAALCQLEVTH